MNNIVQKLIELVYPNKCIECGKVDSKFLCNKCKVKLKFKYEVQKDEYKNKNFKNHIYLFKYDGWVRDQIIRYKFRNKAYLYRFFALLIIEENNRNNFLDRYDVIIPIPISKKRRKTRGYNQSELIAKEITKQIKNIECTKIINKKSDNKPQSTLDKKQRAINVKNVYEINKKVNYEKIINKNILIIDDIYTTGNTANEVARILKEAGFISIDVLTIAKD